MFARGGHAATEVKAFGVRATGGPRLESEELSEKMSSMGWPHFGQGGEREDAGSGNGAGAAAPNCTGIPE